MAKSSNRLLKLMLVNKILIGIVPIIILLFVFFIQMFAQNNTNFLENQKKSTVSSAEQISSKYIDLMIMQNKINAEAYLSGQNEAPDFDLLKRLSRVSLPRTFFSYFIYYFYDNNFFYFSSETTIHKDNFNADDRTIFQIEDFSHNEFLQLLNSVDSSTLLTQRELFAESKTENCLILLLPIYHNSSRRVGVTIAVLPVKNLSQLLGASDSKNFGNLVMDTAGNTIFSDIKFENHKIADLESGTYKNENGYYFFAHKTDFFDCKYIRVASSNLANPISGNSFIFYIVIPTIFCISWILVIIIISIRKEYAPIRNISDNIKKYISCNFDNSINDEILILKKAQEYLENFEIIKTDALASTESNMSSYYHKDLEDVLNGLNRGQKLFFEERENCYFRVLIAQSIQFDEEKLIQLDVFLSKLDAVWSYDNQRILICLRFVTNSEFNRSTEIISQFFENDKKYFLAIGIDINDEKNIYQSFKSADFTLKFMQGKNVYGIYSYDLLHENNQFNSKEILDALNDIFITAKSLSKDKFDSALNGIIELLLDEAVSIEDANMIFQFTKNILLQELKKRLSSNDFKKLETLFEVKIENVNIMIMLLNSLKSNIFLTRIEKADASFDMDSVAEYIETNFLNEDFSLKSIAEAFSSNESLFSKNFKKHFGVNFKNYIDKKIMAKACQLLKESDLTIAQISEICNYSNPSNFLRAFKLEMGTTAGQYRDE